MSYNQSFTPQSGQGNLSAQFGSSQRRQSQASAPQDIPGRARRQSSVSSGYGSYPFPQGSSSAIPSGAGYMSGSPGMEYGHHGAYASSPSQYTKMSPSAHYSQPHMGGYGTSPSHLHPVVAPSKPSAGWQNPSYAHSSGSHHSTDAYGHRRSSASSSSRSYHSGSSSSDEKMNKPKRRYSAAPSRYDSPRRPTMSESVIAAWGGLLGAFDKRR